MFSQGDSRASPFKRHRFPAEVGRQAVRLYFRFTLSLRDLEEMPGIEVSYETIGCWTIKFGPRSLGTSSANGRRRALAGHDAVLKRLKRLLRNQPVEPEAIITDSLSSHGPALKELGLEGIHRPCASSARRRGRHGRPPQLRCERVGRLAILVIYPDKPDVFYQRPEMRQ
jgi:transposase-like protein